jgi:hypothetical protein
VADASQLCYLDERIYCREGARLGDVPQSFTAPFIRAAFETCLFQTGQNQTVTGKASRQVAYREAPLGPDISSLISMMLFPCFAFYGT